MMRCVHGRASRDILFSATRYGRRNEADIGDAAQSKDASCADSTSANRRLQAGLKPSSEGRESLQVRVRSCACSRVHLLKACGCTGSHPVSVGKATVLARRSEQKLAHHARLICLS